MEYKWQSPLTKTSGFTIGFLDENSYYEYHSQMTMGIFEAAGKYGMNVIRFGHFGTLSNIYKYDSYINMELDHIRQYDLDGLLFLGWARLLNFKTLEHFRERFDSIPILSLGSKWDGIPGVFFQGATYIRELLLHLINVHNLKKIAFIAPFWPDPRCDVYIDTMKAYGIYDPQLFVAETDLPDFDLIERGQKAVSILLDERKVICNAVVSLLNPETKAIIDELQSRGFRIPDDIAVTSYEDGEIGKFASPSLTTIYFPWKEIGYYGCEKMYELLTQGHIPESTIVPGRIILRDSCGCLSELVRHTAKSNKITVAAETLSDITGFTLQKIWEEWRQKLAGTILDPDILLKAFIKDYHHQSNMSFLPALELQLRKITLYQQYTECETIISTLRTLMLPYVIPEPEKFLWAENLFQQAQVLILEKKEITLINEKIQSENRHFILQEIGQILITSYTLQNIMDLLALNLSRINIPSCYIFLFKNNGNQKNLFDDYELVFKYHRGVITKLTIGDPGAGKSAKQSLTEILFPETGPYSMMTELLHVGNAYIGFAVFESSPVVDESIYWILSLNISTALSDAILLEKLDSNYKKLIDQAHQEGMAEIITEILHNISNILNNINASIHFVKDLIYTSPLESFIRASQLLENRFHNLDDFIGNDPKGKTLMQYFIKQGEAFHNFQTQLLENVSRLNEKINLINNIIATQQNYTGIKSSLEVLDIVPLIEDALKMNLASLEKDKIKIIRNYLDITKIQAQKIKLFHVLVNLIKNAQDAMLKVPEAERRLILSTARIDNYKYIRITDTGHGIPQDLLEKIFAYGYTTKKGGHGFGLHSCANYMVEMGAKIWAESAGPGKGATFVLQFK